MYIVDVKLENIKSHKNSDFHFERGTTAIVGENGAGKTTIIEAVAWALFDLLDYKKDDFVRRGAKKGSVVVTFESTQDERFYSVYRDTGTGYNIFDPELGVKVADKKEDVSRFLRDHLGVEQSADLELLFRTAVGVPQGTFTAIFLDSAARRKDTFDKLLKVEEYRQSADKLLATTRYIENQLNEVGIKIARSEGELSRLDVVENEHKEISAQLVELNAGLEALRGEESKKRTALLVFEKEEAKVKDIQSSLDKLKAKLVTSGMLLAQKQGQVIDAVQAVEKLKAVESSHLSHLSALAELKTLETQRTERDKIQDKLKNIETEMVRAESEQRNLQGSLERSIKAQEEISSLSSLIKRQRDMETRREVLRSEEAQIKAFLDRADKIEERLKALRDDFTKNATELKEAEEKSRSGGDVDALGKQETELTRRIASLQAKLESDERFQREIKNGLCPILSQKCLNLSEGETLEGFLDNQFDGIKAEIKSTEITQAEIGVALRVAREAAQFAKTLETLQRRQEEITALGTELRKDKDTAAQHAKDQPRIQDELKQIDRTLKEIKNPRERVEILTREAENAGIFKTRIAENQKELDSVAGQKSALLKELEAFSELEQSWKMLSTERDSTADAHREYLANELLAKTLPEREKLLQAVTDENKRTKEEAAGLEQTLVEAAKNYDSDKHLELRAEILTIDKTLADLNARLSFAQKRQIDLGKELRRLTEIQASMKEEYKEKARLEKIGEATKFIRDTLKEAAPRVARNYVYHISNESSQLFREITGNPERSLKWNDEYAIMLEEGGYERPFQSLSGGEQMAAALSIRLALLKQLSDVRMAFFDEPTTNMDSVRRQNLAEHISHITEKDTFDQLFVISHDDTFEEYVDNVVTVGGEGNASVSRALG